MKDCQELAKEFTRKDIETQLQSYWRCWLLRLGQGEDNFTLQRVQLGGNCMGSEGILALSSSLKCRECPIEALSLPDNEIDDNGVRTIATSLQSNVNLRELFLHGNRIGSAGATCLASALRQNQTLKSLDLSNNCITLLICWNKTAHSCYWILIYKHALMNIVDLKRRFHFIPR